MRTINEVVAAVQNGERCTIEELLATLLALNSLHTRARWALQELANAVLSNGPRAELKVKFELDELKKTRETCDRPATALICNKAATVMQSLNPKEMA